MFAVGDKVACVDDAPYRQTRLRGSPWPMKKGSVWLVVGVTVDRFGAECIYLKGIQSCSKYGWLTTRFRKIQPCEPEFIELLNRIKPKVDA